MTEFFNEYGAILAFAAVLAVLGGGFFWLIRKPGFAKTHPIKFPLVIMRGKLIGIFRDLNTASRMSGMAADDIATIIASEQKIQALHEYNDRNGKNFGIVQEFSPNGFKDFDWPRFSCVAGEFNPDCIITTSPQRLVLWLAPPAKKHTSILIAVERGWERTNILFADVEAVAEYYSVSKTVVRSWIRRERFKIPGGKAVIHKPAPRY